MTQQKKQSLTYGGCAVFPYEYRKKTSKLKQKIIRKRKKVVTEMGNKVFITKFEN